MKRKLLVWVLLAFSAAAGACRKGVPTPTIPTTFKMAEYHFEAGKYAESAEAYEQYLHDNPAGDNQDRALFRLGLSYSFPDSPVRDLQRAVKTFRRLVTTYPQSPFRREAEVILALQTSAEKLRADVREREDRIKALDSELEQLKKIDMQRRPSRPPN